MNTERLKKLFAHATVRQYVSGGGATLATELLKPVLGLVTLSLLTRILSDSHFGSLQYLRSWMMLAVPLLSLGQNRTLLYRIAGVIPSDKEERTLRGAGFLRRVLILQLCVAAPIILVSSLSFLSGWPSVLSGQFQPWLMALSIVLLLTGWQESIATWLRSNHEFVLPSLIPMVVPAVTAPAYVAVWLWFPGPGPVAIVLVAAAFTALLVLSVNVLGREREDEPSTWNPGDFSYGLKVIGTKFTHILNERLDILMVGALLGTTMAGPYSIAMRLSIFANMGNKVVGSVFGTRLRSAIGQSQYARVARETSFSRMLSFGFGLWFLSAVVFLGPPLLELVGADIVTNETMTILLLLSFAHVMKQGFGPVGRYLSMSGYSGTTLVFSIVSVAVAVAANLLLIPKFGAVGAATGTLIALVMVNSMMVTLVKLRWNFPLMGKLELVLIVLLLGALASDITGLGWSALLPSIVLVATVGYSITVTKRAKYYFERTQRNEND